jgi:hypothetical protein
MTSFTKQCLDCRQTFAITPDEEEYFTKQGWPLPVRCPICRGLLEAAKKDKFRGKKRG